MEKLSLSSNLQNLDMIQTGASEYAAASQFNGGALKYTGAKTCFYGDQQSSGQGVESNLQQFTNGEYVKSLAQPVLGGNTMNMNLGAHNTGDLKTSFYPLYTQTQMEPSCTWESQPGHQFLGNQQGQCTTTPQSDFGYSGAMSLLNSGVGQHKKTCTSFSSSNDQFQQNCLRTPFAGDHFFGTKSGFPAAENYRNQAAEQRRKTLTSFYPVDPRTRQPQLPGFGGSTSSDFFSRASDSVNQIQDSVNQTQGSLGEYQTGLGQSGLVSQAGRVGGKQSSLFFEITGEGSQGQEEVISSRWQIGGDKRKICSSVLPFPFGECLIVGEGPRS